MTREEAAMVAVFNRAIIEAARKKLARTVGVAVAESNIMQATYVRINCNAHCAHVGFENEAMSFASDGHYVGKYTIRVDLDTIV